MIECVYISREDVRIIRIWFKMFKDNHLIRDIVIEKTEPELSRTKKIFASLDEVCHEWDLAVPMWLDPTIRDFKNQAKARFYSDSFNEEVDFDFLEIHVIEE